MRTVRCSGRLSWHAHPHYNPTMHAPLTRGQNSWRACENITFPQLLLRTYSLNFLYSSDNYAKKKTKTNVISSWCTEVL